MSLLSLLQRKESQQRKKPQQKPEFSAQEEEQRAIGFLNAITQEQDIEKALESVREFQRLVIASPQREKYDSEARFRALGHRLFAHTLQSFPDCLFGAREYLFQPPSSPSSTSLESTDTCRLKVFQPLRYFEDALDETLLLWEEEEKEAESREALAFLKGKTKQYAREMAKKTYIHAIQEVAGYILSGCPSPAKPLDDALQNFEKIKYIYAVNIPSALLPKVLIKNVDGDELVESLEKVIYLAALAQTRAHVDLSLQLPLEIFGKDGVLTMTEKLLDAFERYSKQNCFSSEEQQKFQRQSVEQRKKYVQKFSEAENIICQEQNRIYQQWETSIIQGSSQEEERKMKLLTVFTKSYSILLEEKEEEVVLGCKTKLERYRKIVST